MVKKGGSSNKKAPVLSRTSGRAAAGRSNTKRTSKAGKSLDPDMYDEVDEFIKGKDKVRHQHQHCITPHITAQFMHLYTYVTIGQEMDCI